MSLFNTGSKDLETKVALLEKELNEARPLLAEYQKLKKELARVKFEEAQGLLDFLGIYNFKTIKEAWTEMLEREKKAQEEAEKKSRLADEKLAEANQKMEARKQHLNEISIQKFQIENLVALLKKKNEGKIKALKKKVSAGEMTEYNLECQAKKLDREILKTLKKRPEPGQKSQPFFTYSQPRNTKKTQLL